ncbi:MAG: PHP domain-containing protein [Elusimicrobia bacterium]|nr:PHP domain-containing protein [Elusimicrobiota bacterium]MBD3411983.1 PHP domain-containing protein [Elusimicrobiota bacterium]
MNKQNPARFIDLHIHTTASDGSMRPEDVVIYASTIGLAAIAIADHDSTAGIPAALEQGKKSGIEVIPGIELSAQPIKPSTYELHILGYWVDHTNTELQTHLEHFRQARKKRAQTIIDKLKEINIFLETDELSAIAKTRAIGRLHFAHALIKQKFVHNVHEAFDKYLANGRPAYVPKLMLEASEAISLINNAGGIAVLAHPYFGVENNHELLVYLKDKGIQGLEVYHPKHSAKNIKFFKQQADELGLLMTGGSDCHGRFNGSDPQIGTMNVPYQLLEKMKRHKQNRDH